MKSAILSIVIAVTIFSTIVQAITDNQYKGLFELLEKDNYRFCESGTSYRKTIRSENGDYCKKPLNFALAEAVCDKARNPKSNIDGVVWLKTSCYKEASKIAYGKEENKDAEMFNVLTRNSEGLKTIIKKSTPQEVCLFLTKVSIVLGDCLKALGPTT